MKNFKNILLFFVASMSYAQINVSARPDLLTNKNSFIDASGFVTYNVSEGKGLYFPRTNLVNFSFDISDLGQFQYMLTAFDGIVVYNTTKGIVNESGNESATKGKTVSVEPGFYYFYNPEATDSDTDVSKGRWVRIGDKADELTAKKVTGTFNHQGGTITPELTEMPDANDIKSIVSVRFYRVEETGQDPLDGAVMSTSLYSYRKAEKKAVFGHGSMSVSMPEGKYAYEIVYN